ncbi:MAG: toprim domain-containing protein [Denitratisoma sp.]|nr:toprim domain-containing protein [Denitratisoma sp.]
MDQRLHSDIVSRLERDYGFEAKKDWLRKGKCPSCGKKEMYTSAEHPWVLRCPRGNKCGAEYHVKELYPELFASWSDRYKPTPTEPNASADAYLRNGRGFDLAKIAGWYVQENYYHPELKIGSATVRFQLADGVWWERIIDRPERFDRKANFRGAYGGMWWMPPSIVEIPEELWIVEGIFDSIALLHHDIAAASAMSSTNYPAAALKALAERCAAEDKPRPKLVWAFDGGRAGRKASRQFHQRSVEDGWDASAASIPMEGKKELDWNDMHQRGRLGQKDMERYRYHGALLLAKTAQEKALLMYRHNGWNAFSFEFDNRLHWFKLDLERYHKVMEQYEGDKALSDEKKRDLALTESGTVTEIANCYPTALYYQANAITDESWYYFRIDFPHDGPSVNNTFTGGQLASASEFKKRLLGIAAGAVFTGTAGQLDAMLKKWLGRIKTVETVDFIGYSREHAAWVFNDVAVKGGKTVSLNDEDFFDLGRLSIKSLNRSVDLAINTDLKDFSTEWVGLLWQCYHHKGIAALAFWLGTFFAEQIRAKYKSFPFVELVGEPGAGKSTLIEFLWRLAGRSDYEGFDPSNSSMAGRARNFVQVSNLPVVLIEGDRTEEDRVKQKSFNWDEMKPLYNGRSVYSRGVKNSGNETYEPPFRGALVISQNAPVQASDAIMQRICHIGFDLASHTPESKTAADALGQIGVERLSGFILKATLAEKQILATFEERIPHHERRLLQVEGVRNLRIVKNHAQLAALVDALVHVVPLGAVELRQTQAFIEDMAAERQEAINADHPFVQEFWDTYEFLDGDNRLDHSRNDGVIAISLPQYIAKAAEARQQIPDLRDLKKALKTSRTRKFLGNKTVNSALNAEWNREHCPPNQPRPGTVKCWVFEDTPREPSR